MALSLEVTSSNCLLNTHVYIQRSGLLSALVRQNFHDKYSSKCKLRVIKVSRIIDGRILCPKNQNIMILQGSQNIAKDETKR